PRGRADRAGGEPLVTYPNRPGRRFGRPAPKAPTDPWFHLLDLYARLVASKSPADSELAHFLRLRPALRQDEIAWLLRHLSPMMRHRIRTLQLYRWAGERAPLISDAWHETSFAGLEESAFALYRHLREEEGHSPLQARESVTKALEAHGKWVPSPKIRPFPTAGDPLVKLRDFQSRFESDGALSAAPEEDRFSAECSLPADLLGRWVTRFGREEARALAAAMRQDPPLDLRVNTLRTSREDALAKLASLGLEGEAGALSPTCIRLKGRPRVHGLDLYREGLVEIQDEGSQLVSHVLDPRPNWKVLDACAGAGGKTLHLAALMKGRGEIHAHDRDERKLEDLRLRARKAQAGNIRVTQPGSIPFNAYDAVLIDAPCMGLGTLRRNPDIAWRGEIAPRMADMVERQAECLRSYAPLVRTGGVLVYTTCSFEPEETVAMLEANLPEGFVPSPIAPVLAHSSIALELAENAHTITLLPSVHGTDGFFVARFLRER
ncbi:hypothetical protein GC173_13125, partial [bacterium]|nr:hypothetical protein [bacterium]